MTQITENCSKLFSSQQKDVIIFLKISHSHLKFQKVKGDCNLLLDYEILDCIVYITEQKAFIIFLK